MTSRLDVLRRARGLIAHPVNWTQNAFARRDAGDAEGCASSEPEASCWCAMGAVLRAAYALGGTESRNLSTSCGRVLFHALPEEYREGRDISWAAVTRFNDLNGHADVLALFDRAIASEAEAPP